MCFNHLPCSENADNVHEEPRLHHVRGLHAAGAVHDGVGSRGHGKHEGITHTHLVEKSKFDNGNKNGPIRDRDTHGAGHHQVHGIGAEREGHLGEDGHQDVGTRRVARHLRHKGADKGDDEAEDPGTENQGNDYISTEI